MADRVEIRMVTCPAGTPQSSPQITDLSFNPGAVQAIEIVIPDGHAGLTGLAIGRAGGVEIPASGAVWIVGNDEVVHWPYTDELNNGSWQAQAYNTDASFDHTWFIRFLVNENQLAPPPPVQPIAASAIVAAGTAALGGLIE